MTAEQPSETLDFSDTCPMPGSEWGSQSFSTRNGATISISVWSVIAPIVVGSVVTFFPPTAIAIAATLFVVTIICQSDTGTVDPDKLSDIECLDRYEECKDNGPYGDKKDIWRCGAILEYCYAQGIWDPDKGKW